MTLSGGETTQLRAYVLAKQQVTACVRALKQFVEAQHKAESGEKVQALLVKLAEDRFNLVVVGQFKRGKSSLMNAVIGRDLLPTGLLPLTSAITTLCYGPHERVLLRRKGWAFAQEISLSEIAEYITERGNPGNEKALIEARVELPVRFLRRGLHFIDTPGVGSTRQENTATTYSFLPEADAIIFVTSVEAPLSESEQTFLNEIRHHVRKLFVIVNKIDLLNSAERKDVLDYVRQGIHTTVGTTDIHLYPVSARQALEAKLNGHMNSLQQSGLVEMEEALTTFLSREQGPTFLVAVLDRALSILAELSNHSLEPVPADVLGALQAIGPNGTADGLREQMVSLRAGLLNEAHISVLRAGNQPVSADAEVLEEVLVSRPSAQPRNKPRAGICPICSAQSQNIFDFFAHWQYMLATSEPAQRAFIATHGFCAVHTWQFQQIASPQGISEGYAPLLDFVVVKLRQLLEEVPERPAQELEALLSGTLTCPACRLLRETEREQIRQFLLQLAAPDGKERYLRSEGLCLPHLHAALVTSCERGIVELLVQAQVRHLEEISEDMHNYALKRDALRRGLLNIQETNAWRRALAQLVGEPTARVPR